MPLPTVAKGALIGGGVGLLLAAVRRPSHAAHDHEQGHDHEHEHEHASNGGARVVKSIAEGALAGAVVAFALDRRLRSRAAELIAEGAPVVVDAVTELARRYEPAVERLAETARDRAVDAYEVAYPRVVDAYEAARPRVIEAYEAARPLLDDAATTVRDRAHSLAR
jgi:hypothetical protein